MTDSTDSTEPAVGAPERRPGGRTARVRAQVLDAVRAELAEAGHEGLTVEGVAARAGVHRTTVYRRWRDVGGLLVDVIAAAGEMDWQPPDTGSLRGDLTALNREIQESLVVRPSFAVALMAASFHSEQAARAQTRLWADRYAQCEILVERAVARGELPVRGARGATELDARSLLIAATAPVYHQVVLLRADPDPRLPERAAAAAVLAAAAGAFSVPRTEGA
ncbi:TetR/AcrR family transcriptional regulator [Streptomyces lividans]|uniref:TetR family transcriptional regulator n=3 Tax=Streptomyces TaxID=1883 RepID=A0ABN4DUS5_STRLI|nr:MULTISPECIES: TetR/AcrR family transcriptional regulator [Streptomyces]QSJ10083.1 tetR family transcriptional regulator [Streptomyces lividans]AIJ14547.1 tetR family transcriptional regulator [Streptomyces lividans TK24]EFD67953.1 tetR family transcriptional regulator [Streptomyces lividans TK24]EOY49039.1 putative tetR family transcriptional regulator [Streptomyces lividans 1326]KKD12463.1 TetR family transcriptional regulator [Streptomyces sp. WM6391]